MNQWFDQFTEVGDYLLILLLSGIIYRAAFASPLPLLKNVIVYLALAAGVIYFLFLIFWDFRSFRPS